jgi:hypothetical protein
MEPVQHHYPAVLVGQFGARSKAKKSGRRDRSRLRIVAVANRGWARVRMDTAESIGSAKDATRLYDLSDSGIPGLTIDDQWTHAENRLPELGDALDAKPVGGKLRLSADLFLRVLVPLLAQLLVRHPEWEGRYADRTRALRADDAALSRAELNLARNLEYLCLCGVLIEREVWVLHDAQRNLVSSDLGFSQAVIDIAGTILSGYLFPLSAQTAVFVGAGRERTWSSEASVDLNERHLTVAEVEMQNQAIARWAPTTVFGRQSEVVASAITIWQSDATRPQYADLVPAAVLERRFSPIDVERFLRALHEGEALVRPTADRAPFEQCATCRAQMEWVTRAFANTSAMTDDA